MRRPSVFGLVLLGVLLATLALLPAGCSTDKPNGAVTTPTPTEVVGPLPKPEEEEPVPPQYENGDPTAGKAVFASASCGACHTLSDAGTSGTVGPNLDEAQPELALVVDRVVNGQGAMPPFKDTLTDKQIADVAAYVVEATS